jgi:hypothetical protein
MAAEPGEREKIKSSVREMKIDVCKQTIDIIFAYARWCGVREERSGEREKEEEMR